LERGEVEVMPHSRERRQRLGWDRVQELAGVAEVLGQVPSHLEVELRLLPAGDVAVHVLDLRRQSLAVYERASVELRQSLRRAHPISRGANLGTHRYLLVAIARLHQRAV
jgi:hypothetical protein